MLIISLRIYVDHIVSSAAMYFMNSQFNSFPTHQITYIYVFPSMKLHIDYVDEHRCVLTMIKTW